MKKILMPVFLILSATAPTCPPAFSAEPPAPGMTAAQAEKKVTVRFRDISLSDYLKFISRETGLNFDPAPEINPMSLTLFGRGIPISALMEILVKSKGLEFQKDPRNGHYLVKKAKDRAAFTPLTRKELEDPLLQSVVTVRVKEAPLASFLEAVCEQGKVNFILASESTGIRITAELDQTTVADILQFLRSRGFEYSRLTGTNIFLVRPSGNGAKMFSDAETAFNGKKYEISADIYKEISEKNPDSDMADYALLMSAVSYDWLAARDNSPQALKSEEAALRRLIKDYPASPRLGDAYLYLGQIYSGHTGAVVKEIDCKKALEFYALAVKNTYRDWVKAQAEVRTGQCYEMDGDTSKARAAYK